MSVPILDVLIFFNTNKIILLTKKTNPESKTKKQNTRKMFKGYTTK